MLAALVVGHLADHKRTALDLLADVLELLDALLLCSLARRLHGFALRSFAGAVKT
jgi:hypothetical protein